MKKKQFTALLACPFCGEPPAVQHWHGLTATRVIACSNDGCAPQPLVYGRTVERAAKGWNTRKPELPKIKMPKPVWYRVQTRDDNNG